MIDGILSFAIRQRWLVMIGVLGMAAFGAWNFTRLPIDAVPDITNVQIQINSRAPGYSPLEAEQRITFPIETAMAGIPRLTETRSVSRYGLSQVTVVFEDGTDIYWARQLIAERLSEVKSRLPDGVAPTMGPIATGLGEIFMYTVSSEPGAGLTPTDLRTVQDWIIKPQLRNTPGVVEVNTIGGYTKQFHVLPDPDLLLAHDLSLQDLMSALARNNLSTGAGYIERSGAQYLIRSPGQLADLDDIRGITVAKRDGVPIHMADVAAVTIGHELRTGAATQNGSEVVLGTVFMLVGENSRVVARATAERLAAIGPSLPRIT